MVNYGRVGKCIMRKSKRYDPHTAAKLHTPRQSHVQRDDLRPRHVQHTTRRAVHVVGPRLCGPRLTRERCAEMRVATTLEKDSSPHPSSDPACRLRATNIFFPPQKKKTQAGGCFFLSGACAWQRCFCSPYLSGNQRRRENVDVVDVTVGEGRRRRATERLAVCLLMTVGDHRDVRRRTAFPLSPKLSLNFSPPPRFWRVHLYIFPKTPGDAILGGSPPPTPFFFNFFVLCTRSSK
jgi:hypothetical protein